MTPTAGGIVFFGDMGGNFYVLDTANGRDWPSLPIQSMGHKRSPSQKVSQKFCGQPKSQLPRYQYLDWSKASPTASGRDDRRAFQPALAKLVERLDKSQLGKRGQSSAA
jgi:hypothetical protein